MGIPTTLTLSGLEMSVKVIPILKTCVPHEEAELSSLGNHVRLQSIGY